MQFNDSTEALNALYRLAESSPRAALSLLRKLDSIHTNDIHYVAFRPGVIINAGFDLDDAGLIREGVDALAILLESGDPRITPWRKSLLYNMGNGLYDLATRERRTGHDPDNPLLQQTKQAFLAAISTTEGYSDPHLLAELYTNYGNALAACGRHYEALLAYDGALRQKPSHSMALGNKGIELARFAFLARNQSGLLLAEAYELCRAGANDEELDRRGLAGARATFVEHRDSLEPYYTDWRERLEIARARQDKPAGSTDVEADHHRFATGNDLYLNLCVHAWPCDEKHTDALFFHYIAPLEDPHVFDRLARYFNQAKEDYATARYLLVEAQRPTPLRQRISDRTLFADLLEYADYGLTAGLAKAAYAAAYNILDKIAVFLKWELELPDSETDATFRRIWYPDRKTDTLRPEITAKNDPGLFALYDMSLELRQPEFKRLGDLRRAITHRHLVTHDWLLMVGENANEGEHIKQRDLIGSGISMLRFVKAALIYLAAYLSQEHDRRVASSKGVIAPLIFVWQHEMR